MVVVFEKAAVIEISFSVGGDAFGFIKAASVDVGGSHEFDVGAG